MDTDQETTKKPKPTCYECGAEEGQLHEFGCFVERCPFCGGQLASCPCLGRKIDVQETEDGFVNEEQSLEWEAMLTAKGRYPFIVYPLVCAKCGALWPDLFMAPDEEWERYIQPNIQEKILCFACYEYIKDITDAAAAARDGS